MAKIILTETQFKTYCRKLLNEKRSEDYAKNVLNEEGEGIEAMGSAPSNGYGKYGFLMHKLDEEGDKAIEFILQDAQKFAHNGMFTTGQVDNLLQRLKSSMIHSLDTRYW